MPLQAPVFTRKRAMAHRQPAQPCTKLRTLCAQVLAICAQMPAVCAQVLAVCAQIPAV